MQSFFKKNSPHTLGGGRRHSTLFSYLFPFLKVSSLTFVVETTIFQPKLPIQYFFKVTQYGYEKKKNMEKKICNLIWSFMIFKLLGKYKQSLTNL